MLNHCVLIGRIKNHFEQEGTLILHVNYIGENKESFVIPVHVTFSSKENFIDYLENETVIGIKGKIALDDKNQFFILADKLTFLSSKKKDGDDCESE